MLITVSTIAQLPQALTLGQSFLHYHPDQPFVIGLADDPTHLPTGWQSPYPVLTLADAGFSADALATLSARYTPTEFRAAVKPAFIRAAYERYFQTGMLYADPSGWVLGSLARLFDQVVTRSLLLNPHWLMPPADDRLPDEKYLQNVGLFSHGLIGFGRQPETRRMLDWWHDRVQEHAHLDFCQGQCLDQLWLMHVPALFTNTALLKEPGLQVALWNLPERQVQQTETGWQVHHAGQTTPLLTADFMGLTRADEGLFQQQNRLLLKQRPDVQTLVTSYRQALHRNTSAVLTTCVPAYGQRPEVPVRRGWRQSAYERLIRLSRWIDTIPVRPIHR